jgi:hypothetical protein
MLREASTVCAINKLLHTLLKSVCAALPGLLIAMTAIAQGTPGTPQSLGRIISPAVETVVVRVDQKSREITLSEGSTITYTVYAPEQVVNIMDVKPGDRVLGTYSASVEGDIRAAGSEDMATPWQVLEEGVLSERDGVIQVEQPRVIQAVLAVLGTNRSAGVLIGSDSRGFSYFIAHVEPDKLVDLSVGQRVVVVFSEAMVTSFQKLR